MNSAFLLLPDFLLILLGFLLVRYTSLHKDIWTGAEKLVYYLLFPALLFNSINQTRFDWSGTSTMVLVAASAFFSAMFLGYISQWFFKANHKSWASGFQTSFRFNSYIAFAAAGRLAGEEGVALMALISGCLVPIANAAAVWALAKHSETHLLKEIGKNPLIIATVLGLGSNLLGLTMPDYIAMSLQRLGAASIALGLLSVGAGLMWIENKKDGALIAYWTTVKLMIAPAIALTVGRLMDLPPAQLTIVVLFGALPTATSAYVLANRMKGDGPLVAACISVMTLLASLTLPIWLSLV
ncbi:MAG: AEC family transporter [Polynucleobacter sp.]|nr:MAG: AEC family transporter [Polynucleobacter sp.]